MHPVKHVGTQVVHISLRLVLRTRLSNLCRKIVLCNCAFHFYVNKNSVTFLRVFSVFSLPTFNPVISLFHNVPKGLGGKAVAHSGSVDFGRKGLEELLVLPL